MAWLNSYIKKIDDIRQSGADTELSYRAAIDNMLNAAAEEAAKKSATATLKILHEPQRQKGNAPDFRITNEGGAVVGYVECKKPGADLSAMAAGEQLKRYGNLSPNIILTDGWRWLLLRNGKNIHEARIGAKVGGGAKDDFISLLNIFFTAEAEKIGDSKRLAASLAARCELLRQELVNKINGDKGKLRGLFAALQKLIYRDMTTAQFADAFAQTTVYALLMAKLRAGEGEKPDLYTVEKYIPQTFALIRELSGFLRELESAEYGELRWIVEDILAIVNNMDVAAVIETMSYTQKTGTTDRDDPFLYFYENFLADYNAKLRKSRGVYYTPLPVVRFIVRAIDDTLKDDFGMKNGLADKTVTALDFATGTGTFILETMRLVLNGKSQAKRKALTKEHLLKNCYGFEFLIAPYAIAHLKLSQFLADMQCGLNETKKDKQLKIFLTNTLEQANGQGELSLLPALSDEARGASEIKKSPVLVIMGNPPYSGHSQNKGDFIRGLIHDYYQVDGHSLNEHNPKMLQDDYVKFIRFAQYKMQGVKCGIVAIITNHGFLDNPTFRGMRQSLMNTFDQLYFLDLHGNSRKKETAPDGGKDDNVFDIQQGVGVSLLIKNPALKKGIFHCDLFGKQQYKYDFCEAESIKSIKWRALKPTPPYYLFVPNNKTNAKIYQTYPSIIDVFSVSSTGIKTHRDHFAFAFDKHDIEARIKNMATVSLDNDTLRQKYNITDTRDWNLTDARKEIMNHPDWRNSIRQCLYRPFDVRWCYYGQATMELPRETVMRHMLARDNLGLVSARQVKVGKSWQHITVSETIAECTYLSNKTSEITYLFPLYLYDSNGNGDVHKTENIKPAFRRWIDNHYGKKLSPENIMGYIYAVLHSPDYRYCYADLLRIDFPHVPFVKDINEFNRLAKIGGKLMKAHLLKDDKLKSSLELHGGNLQVEKIKYHEAGGKLFINNDTYFAPLPPEVFNFPIGGYLPLDKYLKSRKGRELTLDDVETIQKAAAAIAFTIKQMAQINIVE